MKMKFSWGKLMAKVRTWKLLSHWGIKIHEDENIRLRVVNMKIIIFLIIIKFYHSGKYYYYLEMLKNLSRNLFFTTAIYHVSMPASLLLGDNIDNCSSVSLLSLHSTLELLSLSAKLRSWWKAEASIQVKASKNIEIFAGNLICNSVKKVRGPFPGMKTELRISFW